jgi:hypothetical protein
MSAPPPRGLRPGRRSSRRLPIVALVLISLLLAACSGGSSGVVDIPSGVQTSSSLDQSPSATPPPPTGLTALITSLPAGCDQGVPGASATITFAAEGRGWAAAPDGTGLTCFFDVADPGIFAWGPKADRVVLSGLEVRGVGSTATRPAKDLQPAAASWGRPTGLALAFIDTSGTKIEKALVGGGKIENVSPFDNVTYREVVYHPSGLALAFVLTDSDGSSIWISSNTGADPKRLVWSKEGTIFGPIAFTPDGRALAYGARLANGQRTIAELTLGDSGVAQKLWVSGRDVQALIPRAAGGALVDAGSGCADRQALLSQFDGTEGEVILPDAEGPTSALGWLDETEMLVSEGGCSGPFDLWVADTAVGDTPTLLVKGVSAAAVRVPDQLPTPGLPDIGVNEGAA